MFEMGSNFLQISVVGAEEEVAISLKRSEIFVLKDIGEMPRYNITTSMHLTLGLHA